MKELIINADDLGADEQRNQGIFEAMRAGMVTSVSILANGPAFPSAVRNLLARSFPPVSFGIHVNLSEGRPLSDGLSLLTGADGLFPGKAAAYTLLSSDPGRLLKEEISKEVQAQISALINTGLSVSHIDGHQHVHILPAVWEAVVQSALDFSIPWIRIPDEPVPSRTEPVPPGLNAEAKRFSEPAAAARPHLERISLRAPDHFRGLYLKGQLSATRLINLINELPKGLTELMVHPGRTHMTEHQNIFSAFSTTERQRELEALLDPSVSAALKDSEVVLTSFSDRQQ